MVLLKKLLNSWFDEIFSEFLIFQHCGRIHMYLTDNNDYLQIFQCHRNPRFKCVSNDSTRHQHIHYWKRQTKNFIWYRRWCTTGIFLEPQKVFELWSYFNSWCRFKPLAFGPCWRRFRSFKISRSMFWVDNDFRLCMHWFCIFLRKLVKFINFQDQMEKKLYLKRFLWLLLKMVIILNWMIWI